MLKRKRTAGELSAHLQGKGLERIENERISVLCLPIYTYMSMQCLLWTGSLLVILLCCQTLSAALSLSLSLSLSLLRAPVSRKALSILFRLGDMSRSCPPDPLKVFDRSTPAGRMLHLLYSKDPVGKAA